MINSNVLGGMNPEQFLQEYWQKKPLLIRQAFPNFESPITADELAGLACEPEVNSRIVIEKGGDHEWQAIHGPMDEDIFASMLETHWTLVVNDVEKYLPDFAEITDKFRFIPEWFLDDLMISWAADQGTVGPHVDLYDVFILQGSGTRRWQINTQPIDENNYIPDIDLRLMKEFNPELEWILNPGDMMYLPPGVAHHGVSLGESISYSVGYRATSHHDLLNDFMVFITEDLAIDKTYRLTDLSLQKNPNEIKPAAISQLRDIFTEYLNPNHPALESWFGRFVSDPKANYDSYSENDNVDSFEQLLSYPTLYRHPASRFAFIRKNDASQLFVDGEEYSVSFNFAKRLCHNRQLDLEKLSINISQDEQRLLVELYNQHKIID